MPDFSSIRMSPGSFVWFSLASLKLTANAPENGPKSKGKVVFQPSSFRGKLAVSFREGKLFVSHLQWRFDLVPKSQVRPHKGEVTYSPTIKSTRDPKTDMTSSQKKKNSPKPPVLAGKYIWATKPLADINHEILSGSGFWVAFAVCFRD